MILPHVREGHDPVTCATSVRGLRFEQRRLSQRSDVLFLLRLRRRRGCCPDSKPCAYAVRPAPVFSGNVQPFCWSLSLRTGALISPGLFGPRPDVSWEQMGFRTSHSNVWVAGRGLMARCPSLAHGQKLQTSTPRLGASLLRSTTSFRHAVTPETGAIPSHPVYPERVLTVSRLLVLPHTCISSFRTPVLNTLER